MSGKWELERVRHFARRMCVPLENNYIHIGGTNGKGSVCAMLESGFRATGMQTGCYTSPHLIRWNERIRVNGCAIADGDFCSLLNEVLALADETSNIPLSCFEILTIAALAHFSRKSVDIAIIEVGLGGRLDATNVITPKVAAITTVGFDHEEILGETLEAIAAEKAGIAKDGVPLVLGHMPAAASKKIRSQVRSPIIPADCTRPLPQLKYLHGVEQAKNIPVALAIAEAYLERVNPVKADQRANWLERFRRGVMEVRWPGRWEKRTIGGRTWIFDCTHNICGLPFLRANWEQEYLPPPAIITATLGIRRAQALFPYLASIARQLILVRLDEPRALPTEQLKELVPTSFTGKIDTIESLENLPPTIIGDGPVLVTGSVHLVGRVLEIFTPMEKV
jgi:dihydrofolate synthase/folylpolyglutamate synthase